MVKTSMVIKGHKFWQLLLRRHLVGLSGGLFLLGNEPEPDLAATQLKWSMWFYVIVENTKQS